MRRERRRHPSGYYFGFFSFRPLSALSLRSCFSSAFCSSLCRTWLASVSSLSCRPFLASASSRPAQARRRRAEAESAPAGSRAVAQAWVAGSSPAASFAASRPHTRGVLGRGARRRSLDGGDELGSARTGCGSALPRRRADDDPPLRGSRRARAHVQMRERAESRLRQLERDCRSRQWHGIGRLAQLHRPAPEVARGRGGCDQGGKPQCIRRQHAAKYGTPSRRCPTAPPRRLSSRPGSFPAPWPGRAQRLQPAAARSRTGPRRARRLRSWP